jgi:hypothetical protein
MSSPPQLPPWVTPEYLAEDARAGPRVGIIVVHVVAFAVVFLRFYARGFLLKSVGIDDYLMGAAAVRVILCSSESCSTITLCLFGTLLT